ncbi:MAG: flagellar basal-body rod protein FlgF [candidate division Zixibacteria bacterium]|nr:flagellar basal-body rod protein FlgF [candidate division Zixibacteria bacterium]
MIKGIYTSASGMIPRVKKQEISANNLANASTPGFKKDQVFTQELTRAQRMQQTVKSDWQQPMVDRTYTNFSPGVLDRTGNPLDLAIDGDGFFQLQLADGSRALTRAGSFKVNSEGLLEYPDGALVMGEGGPIEIGSGTVSVAASGIVQVNGSTAGAITPVTVADVNSLEKIGDSMFVVPDDVELIPTKNSTIQQGFLESSNVDVVREMIDMIISYRNYEANSKALQSQDQSLDNLFSRVAPKG